MRILIVEDEVRLAATLKDLLSSDNYYVDVVTDGERGLDYALSGIYDTIVLDVMLPKLDGLEVVRRLRAEGVSTPVMLLTALSELSDRVNGLNSGADYYLTKPFEPDEFLACVRTLLRRREEVVSDKISFGDVTLDLSTCFVSCGEHRLRLSYKEFEILRLLIVNGKNNIAKETILQKAWEYDTDVGTSQVEVYMSFLRKKLALMGSKVHIEVVRKIGYHLEI